MGGIFNTYFWADPDRQMIGILMTQVYPSDHLKLREEIKRLAYEAMAPGQAGRAIAGGIRPVRAVRPRRRGPRAGAVRRRQAAGLRHVATGCAARGATSAPTCRTSAASFSETC